jgi:hypothetical protein
MLQRFEVAVDLVTVRVWTVNITYHCSGSFTGTLASSVRLDGKGKVKRGKVAIYCNMMHLGICL